MSSLLKLLDTENEFKNLLKQNTIFDSKLQTKRLILRDKYLSLLLNSVFIIHYRSLVHAQRAQ
jgi:hypothetical protein